MKIVYLHQYFVTPKSPGGTRSYEMARRLVAAGHEVHMITSCQDPMPNGALWRETDEAGIRVHWANIPYYNGMSWTARVKAFLTFATVSSRKAMSIRDADVIFASSTPLTIAIPAIFAAWRRRTPYVFEVRDVWPAVPIALGALNNPLLRWLARRLEHTAYHRAAHVVALAPGMAEEVMKTGYPSEKITVIPNGCDNDVFAAHISESPPSLVEWRDWLGDSPLILFAGTLGKANNVGYVADVAAAMLRIDPAVRFAIIGSGADADAIAEKARELKVLGTSLQMIPAIPKHDLAAWIQRSSICLALFSGPRILWKDAVQNKFFDALAAGKPVASNHEGWQCGIAVEHDVGFAIRNDDPGAAAQKLYNAVTDTLWIEGVSGRATALASDRFNRDNLARQLEECLATTVRDAAVETGKKRG
jgi:glycosyltransferase involved in cell wall biosynthesis